MSNGINRIQSIEQAPETAIALEVGERADKNSLLNALSSICAFPEHFGYNWDAAWDCLQDYNVPHLLLDLRNTQSVQGGDLKEFLSVIMDAYEVWECPELWLIERPKNTGDNSNNSTGGKRRYYRRKNNNKPTAQ